MTDAASSPIRTGLVGFGTSGRVFHGPFLSTNPAYSLDVIVTANPTRVEEAKRLHPAADVVSDMDELLARADDLDLVVVGSPPETHASIAEAAMEAGLDVVVDKPFAATASDAHHLVDTAERLGRVLTVFQNRRWDGDFLTVRSLVNDGSLGDVHRFESRFEWWKPNPEASWKTETPVAKGGGILFDLGTHLIDQAIQLFGSVEDVYSEISTRRTEAVADDDVFLVLTHHAGMTSHLWMSSIAAQFGPRFHVLGSRAGFTSWGLDGQELALKAGALPTDEGYGETPKELWGTLGVEGALERYPMRRGDYAEFYRLLADALRSDGSVPVDPRDSVRVLELIETIHSAHS